MRAWRCTSCAKTVSEADLKQGLGRIVERKVYCAAHAPSAGTAAPAAATTVRRRAPVPPAADQAPDAGTEGAPAAPTSRLPLILAGLGGLIVILVAVVAYLTMAGPGDTVAAPSDLVVATGPAPADGPAASAVATGPAAPAAPGTPAPPVVDPAEFEKRLARGRTPFNGTVAGFHEGEALLRRGIIEAELFRDTEYPARAQAAIDAERAIVDQMIEAAYNDLHTRVMAAVNELKQKDALALAGSFPAEYRGFGAWEAQAQAMAAEVRTLAGDEYGKWFAAAKAKADGGDRPGAAADLKEILAAAQGQLLDEIAEKLTRQIGMIESGGSLTADGAPADAAGLLAQAHTAFTFGCVQDAEPIYTQLRTAFAGDPAVMKDLALINGRLQAIAEMKARGADAAVQLLLYDDFEQVWSLGKHGNFWQTGLRQQVQARSNGGYAMKCAPDAENKTGAVRMAGGTPSDMSAWQNEDNAYFSFWYLLEADTPSADHRLSIQCMNRTQADNFHISLAAPVLNQWGFACIPLADWEDNEYAGKKPNKGDEFTGIGIWYGKPGEKAVLYIDNLSVVAGSSLYYIPEKLAAKEKLIAAVTSNPQKDFYRMDIFILDHLVARIGRDIKRDTVLVVGDLHAKDTLLDNLRKEANLKVLRAAGAGTPKGTLKEVLERGAAEVKSKKPGVVFVMAGINDILAATLNAPAEAEAKPGPAKPDAAKPAEAAPPAATNTQEIQALFQSFADAVIAAGSLPVFCTLPPSGNSAVNSRITDVNIAVANVARMNYIPLLDAFSLFSLAPDQKELFANDVALKRGGYKLLNDRALRLMKILQTHILN
ncbi:MAG: SGNH/GDSL hydrolase family protein [Planctomycetota bacterium]